jgi:hypothetical protein
LEKKVLITIFSVALISFTPQVFADEYLDALLEKENGVLVEQQKIIFEVGKHSGIHAKHVIETGAWGGDRPRIIEIMPGIHSNLTIADEDGDTYGVGYDGETFEESKYIILRQKLGNYDLIAEYDLKKFMELENGLWKKEFNFPGMDILIIFEEDIEFIFTNSRPVDVRDAKGINCIGCGLLLEYIHDEKISKKEILFSEGKFEIDVLSNEEIFDIEFIEGGNQIERVTHLLNFDVKNINQMYILKIPHEKFLNPYDVYFTEKDDTSLDQLDKIRKTEFSQDETHVNISFRTFGEGIVSIVGATPEEYQKKLEQIENVKSREAESVKVDENKGLALPIPGTKAASELAAAQMNMKNDSKQTETLSFADELKQGQTQNSENYITIVAIIAGIIAAAVITGIVLKLKKNQISN